MNAYHMVSVQWTCPNCSDLHTSNSVTAHPMVASQFLQIFGFQESDFEAATESPDGQSVMMSRTSPVPVTATITECLPTEVELIVMMGGGSE